MKRILIASMLCLGIGTCLTQPALAERTSSPVITYTLSGTLGTNGWYTTNVGLTWTVSGRRISSTSGCGPVTVSSDTSTTGISYTCTATNSAGTTSQSVTIKRDATLPTISITSPTNSASYAIGQSVIAGYSCTDPASGIATCVGPVANGSPIDTASAGTKTFTVNAKDNAGNQRSASVSYTVTNSDTTPPVITPTVSGTQGNNGWYTSNVSVNWTVTDPGSAITSSSGCGATSVTTDTSGVTFTCSATSAGGTSSNSVTIKRDATRPTGTITTPANGATYTLNQSVAAAYGCNDGTSGIASCTGTVGMGASINTSSTGTKSFSVTATDRAGNTSTTTASYTVGSSTPPVASAGTQVLAWNDLGMHCADSDYSVFTLLPPFNTLNAQLVVGGKLIYSSSTTTPPPYTLTYESMADPTGSINTTSAGNGSVAKKTNFWDYVLSLFGAQPPNDKGLTGNWTASATPRALAWSTPNQWFEATGIPITPFDDNQEVNPFPLVKVTALDSSGQPIASTSAVLPVSSEISCNVCHASGTVFSAGQPSAQPAGGWVNLLAGSERDWRLNVLRLHDEKNRANANYASLLAAKGYGSSLETSVRVGNKPIFCDTCHNSTALAIWGLKGEPATTVSNMTVAMHRRHAGVSLPGQTQTLDQNGTRDACYNCHPGRSTQCLRGAMGNPTVSGGKHEMECQSCHGSMSTVASTTRRGWLDLPTCQACHHDGKRETVAINADGSYKTWLDTRFASNPGTPNTSNSPPPVTSNDPSISLFRYSVGHGKLQCESCHNSTHAEFTNIPSSNGNQVNDNLRAIAFQGYDSALRECTGCHGTTYSTDDTASGTGGPHGMHSVGQSWVNKHHDLIGSSGGTTQCQYCHSSTSTGSALATVKIAKTFNIGDGRTKAFKANDPVTCYSCHNGPNP